MKSQVRLVGFPNPVDLYDSRVLFQVKLPAYIDEDECNVQADDDEKSSDRVAVGNDLDVLSIV